MLLVEEQIKKLILVFYYYLATLEYAQFSSMLYMGIKEALVLRWPKLMR
tara:strand:- start:59 stop:205 length:147 start_codon:yes stop_codon:yes gene_type:complete